MSRRRLPLPHCHEGIPILKMTYDSIYKITDGKYDFGKCEKYPLEIGAQRLFERMCKYPFAKLCGINFPPADVSDEMSVKSLCWHYGEIFSGGAVVSDKDFKKALHQNHINAIGGEMEGAGVHFACYLVEPNEVPCVVIKAICDWGEEKNGWEKVLCSLDQNYFDERLQFILPGCFDTVMSGEENIEEIRVRFDIQNVISTYKDAQDGFSEVWDERGHVPGDGKIFSRVLDHALKIINDCIKDSIQAYATERAFTALCCMLYYNPQLQKLPATSPVKSLAERERDDLKVRQKLLEHDLHMKEQLILDNQYNITFGKNLN